MKLSEKDRAQLLRMAGNIAGGICATNYAGNDRHIATRSAELALATMQAVDKLIEEEEKE